MMQSWIDKIQRGQFDVIWWNWLNKSFDRVIGRMGIIRVLKRIHRDKNRNRKGNMYECLTFLYPSEIK